LLSLSGATLTWCNVLREVLQVSMLGPLLFNIYVIDTDAYSGFCSSVLQFADDFKMCRVIKGSQDFQQLQNILISFWLEPTNDN